MSPSLFPAPRFRRRTRPGFALVAVLLMMVLITLVALGMLSLSTISLRQSTQATDMASARANARLALQFALADLQRTLGPDGRVSATASLLDSNPTTDAIDGVRQPHWTGVWTASKPNANGGTETPWTRDDADGGLKDARATGGWSRTNALDWLVSWPSSTKVDARTAQRDDTWVRMLATGNNNDDVWAPTIEISSAGKGRYGWWVGDEGVKAKINLPDAWAGKNPSPVEAANGGYNHWLASQKNEPQVVDSSFEIKEEKKARILSSSSLALASSATPEKARARFHDFTTYSLGLPVNISAGRLKRDLTAYLTGGGMIADLADGGKVVSPGLTDEDRLVGPANAAASGREGADWSTSRHKESSPRFALLRKWAVAGTTQALQAPPTDMAGPTTESWNDTTYDGTNKAAAAILKMDSSSISPVLVEGSIFYSLTAYAETATSWKLRTHLYPRVVIWNPYNLPLKVPATSLMLHVNGAKRAELTMVDNSKTTIGLTFAGSGVMGGALYFGLDAATLQPGACVVFSPSAGASYTIGGPGANRLSPSTAPSLDKAFTVDFSTVYTTQPKEFREAPTSATTTQAQDYRMLWKNGAAANLSNFNDLKQLSFVSCALQYGDESELPVEWTSSNPVTINTIPKSASPTIPPDVRTRDGFRLRWFTEHPSNKFGSGSLVNTNHFDIAPIANWNPRAAYSVRSPYENLTDIAPQFFGAYTRDLFDAAVSWNETLPVPKDGMQQTWPFGQPIESPGPLVLFDVPRKETGILSLAQFQHAKLSEFIWHPSYAVGNSLPDPRLEERTDRSAPVPRSSAELAMNGWTKTLIGHAAGRTAGGEGEEQWAYYARWAIGNLPATDAVIHDLSFELNRSLWDDFFLSTGTAAQKQSLVNSGAPLPNGRMRLIRDSGDSSAVKSDLNDFHRAASRLGIDGAFNVNSTSVAAWKTVLAGTRGTKAPGETVFPRLLNAPGADWKEGMPANGTAAWSGTRVLDDAALDRLANALVIEVKKRGPFLSLADFVNRRLDAGETGKAGPLEAAIQAAGLNKPFNETYPLVRDAIKNYNNTDINVADATRIDPRLMPESKAWGAPAYLTQADILQPLGPQITARSDTFVIRCYGDSRSLNGTVTARAWCEAVVQRLPDPVTPDGTGLNPLNPGSPADYGRRFSIVGFRWLNPEEV